MRVKKMTEVKKEGIGKRKVALIICAVLVVILAISNVWFFMEAESLKNQVNTLETDKNSLQSQVSNLETDKSQLESQVSSLQANKSSLETQVDSLNSQIGNLQNAVEYGESEIVRLNNIIENLKSEAVASNNEIYLRDRQIDDLEGQISSLNYQINDLNNQINDLRAPSLVNVGLAATDNQLTHTLHIYGWVFNVGHVDVQSSRLHVVAYHRDGTVAIDTYVDLGPVHAVASKRVAVQIAYEGLPIEMSRVTMTPEWS